MIFGAVDKIGVTGKQKKPLHRTRWGVRWRGNIVGRGKYLKRRGTCITLFDRYQQNPVAGGVFVMKVRAAKDRKGVEIREGCTVKTKAFSEDRQEYEYFKVIVDHNRPCIQRRDMWGHPHTYSVDYIQRWLKDDSMEVVMGAPAN